jgi:hypothetical protein
MMTTPIYVNTPGLRLPDPPPPGPGGETVDLLKQLLETQREQLQLARHAAQQADSLGRWRNFLTRWQADFPDAGAGCKAVLPIIERAYLTMITELTDRLRGEDAEDLDNDYVLSEFLDRYGPRLNQLGTILSQLSPLADAAPPPPEPAPAETESDPADD